VGKKESLLSVGEKRGLRKRIYHWKGKGSTAFGGELILLAIIPGEK